MFFCVQQIIRWIKNNYTFPEPGINNVRPSMFGKQQADKQDYEKKKTTEGKKKKRITLKCENSWSWFLFTAKLHLKTNHFIKLCCFCSVGSLFLFAPSFWGQRGSAASTARLIKSGSLAASLHGAERALYQITSSQNRTSANPLQ